MKKLLLTLIASIGLFSTQEALAQKSKGIFVTLNGGYGFATSSQSGDYNGLINNEIIYNNGTTSTYNYKAVYANFGKGANFGGSLGYMFNKSFGLELGFTYIVGSEISSKRNYNYAPPLETFSSVFNTSVSANTYQFKPNVIITTGMPEINPYAKFGLVIGKSKIIQDTDSKNGVGDLTINSYEYTGGFKLGFQGALGMDFKLGTKLGIFTELNFTGYNYSPDKRTLTKAEQTIAATGATTNLLPTYTLNQIELEYDDDYTLTYPQDPNAVNLPSKTSRLTLPFGTFGLNVGVKYHF
jgi:hypothetical protein